MSPRPHKAARFLSAHPVRAIVATVSPLMMTVPTVTAP
jgi:hypothetical protein